MNTEKYKRQLLEEEKRLTAALEDAGGNARDAGEQPIGDSTDETVSSEMKERDFQEESADWVQLRQVREALQRIQDGSYGKCVVDGGPIEEKRLNALPWTPYCIRHQQELESANPPQTPTL